MPDYRFVEPVRQVDYIEFGIALGDVCIHLRGWNFTITSVRLKGGRLVLTTDGTIAPGELPHLGLEAG